MSMQLKILFQDCNYIDVELFGRPAVTKWFNHFRQYQGLYVCKKIHLQPPQTLDCQFIDSYWNEIIKTFHTLKVFTTLPDRFDYNQATLNDLHRFFTCNLKNFPYEIIEKINQSVHQLEKYTVINENRSFLLENYPINDLHFYLDRERLDRSFWLDFTEEEQKLNFEYFNYGVENLVLLDLSILGKCLLQTFYDNDDPTQSDCTGRLGSYGGIFIETDKKRRQIYQSDTFTKWLRFYNLDPNMQPYEFPIGFVKAKSQELQSLLAFSNQFEHILFVD